MADIEKTYQIIEPMSLDFLFSNPRHTKLAVEIFQWLIPQLYLTLGDQLKNVEIDVIRVSYLGNYPAIGLYYRIPGDSDVGKTVESAIERLIREKPAIDFFKFIAACEL